MLVAGTAEAAQCGKAAWYDLGGRTANGERSDGAGMTAAHRTLPFGTKVRVENLTNGREVIVRVNDRGPFVGGRVIDVTRAAAEELGMIRAGIANVRVSVVDGDARLDSSCKDPAPRIITADSVAGRAKATATEPGEPSRRPAPNESKAVARDSTRTLVATVNYDEGTLEQGSTGARGRNAPPGTASFSDEPRLDEIEDARITAARVDIPLPRPRPPIFDDAFASDNPALALRFVDAFAPAEPAMALTIPLGYAAAGEPRGAIITE